MDFQKASGHLADSKVYILTECYGWDGWEQILAVFSTKEAAELAKGYYDSRKLSYSRYYYEIQEWEVLDSVQGPTDSKAKEA